MGYRQYIGARYVPKLMDEWNATIDYEPLSVVNDSNGNSYTSKKFVPKGTPLSDRDYWMETGNMSGSILSLQQRMNSAEDNVINLDERVDVLENKEAEYITPEQHGAVGDGVNDDTTALQAAIAEAWTTGRPLLGVGDYRTTAPLYFSVFNSELTDRYYSGAKIILTGKIIADHSGESLVFDGLFYDCYVKYLKSSASGRGTGIVLRRTNRDDTSAVTTYNDIKFGAIHNFNIGVLLEAVGSEDVGIQYNQITGELIRCENGTCIKGVTNGHNWITQCKFSEMRLMGVVNIDFSENLSDQPTTEMIFDNVGFESATRSGVIARQFVGCHFQNIRMAENSQTDYLFDFVDSYDVHVNGHIWLEVDKIRSVYTELLTNTIARMRAIYFECSRIDSTRNGRWLGTKCKLNYNNNVFITDYANAEGAYAALYNTVLDFSGEHMIPSVYNINNMANDATRDTKVIVPFGVDNFMNRLYIKTGFNNGNPFTVEYPNGTNALKGLSALAANSEYMLFPSPQGFIPCKLA